MNWALLLSSAVLAMASGAVAAVYALGIAGPGLIWEEAIPVALMLVPYAAVPLTVLVAVVAFVMRRLHVRQARWLSQGPWISAGVLVVGSMLLLGPVGGFHHMIRFGVLGYMIVDCESPPGNMAIPFGHCGIRGSAVLLAVTIALWLAAVLMLLRRRASR